MKIPVVIPPWPAYLFKTNRSGPEDYLCEFNHPDYDRARESILWHGDWDGQTDQVLTAFEPYLPEYASVLDVGAGVGRIAKALLVRGQAKFVDMVEPSPEMRRHAGRYMAGTDYWEIFASLDGLIEKFPISLGPIHNVGVMVETAQHVPHRELIPLLRKVSDALEPGAPLLVWGNEHLDVGPGGLNRYPIRKALATTFRYTETRYDLTPQPRWMYVCRSISEAK